MSIFEITVEGAVKLEPAGLTAYGASERDGLLRLLRSQIDIVAPDVLVVGEEVGGAEDASRPIDLLGVDKQGNLVVIDLETAEDRGQLELQAIRHAAMLSAMTFDEITEIFTRHLQVLGIDDSARDLLLAFLTWASPDEERFARDIRIVLAAAEFSREAVRSVLWLNGRGLDIRCVRLRPYSGGTRQFLDVQQVVPAPQAPDDVAPIPREEPQAARAEGQWSGLWFVNVGMDDSEEKPADTNGRGNIRHWENCVRYGYLAGGGGARQSDALRKLEPGAHVVAYQKGEGYLGYGLVTGAAEPIHRLRVEGTRTLAEMLKQTEHNQNRSDDRWEYAVGVTWRKTFPLNNAKWFKGGFANQNIVCKLTDPETVAFLSQEFGIPVQEQS
jgi:hypothetical protein